MLSDLREISHRQLARLPRLGSLRDFAMGIRTLLDRKTEPKTHSHRTARRLGKSATPRFQPRLHRSALRTNGPCFRKIRLGTDDSGRSAHSEQSAATRFHRWKERDLYKQGP